MIEDYARTPADSPTSGGHFAGTFAVDEVTRWIQGCIGPSECVVRGPLFKRNNSQVFYAECVALPGPAAVKLCLKSRTNEPAPESAIEQFEALSRVSDAMNGGAYGVPRPYVVERDRAMVLVEWIEGVTMTETLSSIRTNAWAARQAVAEAGKWLRAFHDAHRLPARRLDVEDKLRRTAAFDAATRPAHGNFDSALDMLRRTAARASRDPLPCSWVHGDFKTDNLIMSGERLIGIDVHVRDENVVVYDLAHFLNQLELASFHPALWRLIPARQSLAAQFVGSYAGEAAEQVELPLAWLQLYFVLSTWNATATRAMSRLRARLLGGCFSAMTARLLGRLSALS